MKRTLLVIVLAVVAVAAIAAFGMPGDDGPAYRTVRVERGTVVREAVVVGRIEPRFEVPVTSTNGGVLTCRFAELGQKVAKDAPLVEVRPVLTDSALLSAERAFLGAAENEENVQELREGRPGWGGRCCSSRGRTPSSACGPAPSARAPTRRGGSSCCARA